MKKQRNLRVLHVFLLALVATSAGLLVDIGSSKSGYGIGDLVKTPFRFLTGISGAESEITHGPRLGAPSSDGFSVWVRANRSMTLKLEVSTDGAFWTDVDERAVRTSMYNTCILTASGLKPETAYHYRVTESGNMLARSSTVTMPSDRQGSVLIYVVADGHGENQAIYDAIIADRETEYPGRPAVILQIGDLYNLTADETTTKSAADVALLEIEEIENAAKKIPVLFMWDDWDFAGNNSAGLGNMVAFSSESDPQRSALDLFEWLWGEAPRPDPPSRCYAVEICGIPVIISDQRSQRTHPVKGIVPELTGNEALDPTISAFGAAHRQFYIDTLRSYRNKDLVLFVSSTTLRSTNVTGIDSPDIRDSVGMYFQSEKNYIFKQGCAASPYEQYSKLVVLSGDDHRNSAWKQTLTREETSIEGNYFHAPWRDVNGGGPVPHWEFKVISGPSTIVGNSTGLFGVGNLFEWSGPNHNCFLRIDLQSFHNGSSVAGRFTYIHVGLQEPPGTGGIPTASRGRRGDFWYEKGHFLPYYESLEETDRNHLPENGRR
jgi:hypothetical protein